MPPRRQTVLLGRILVAYVVAGVALYVAVTLAWQMQ